MRKQTTATLLCALLISTLAHEYLQHQHPPAQKRVSKQRSNHLLSHQSQKRDGSDSNEVCGWQCPDNSSNSTGDIKIVINVNASIIGFVNLTSNIGIAFSVSENIVMLLNGTNGNIIIVDVQAKTGVHVTGQSSSLLWVSSKVTFEVYIKSLTSLKVVYNYAVTVGTKFSVSSASHEILQLVGTALISFGLVIGKEINADLSNSLQVLVQLSNRLSNIFQGALSGILALFNGTAVIVSISISVFVEICEGLGKVIKQISGGIGTLIKLKIQLDWEIILTAKSGIELLTYLFEVFIASGVDVVSSFGGLTIEKLFSLIIQLSGSASAGYSGFVRVVGLVICVVKGSASIDTLIDALVQLSISAGLDANVSEQLASSLKGLLKILAKLNVNGKISATIQFVEKLVSGGLVISGVNISAVIVLVAAAGTQLALYIVIGVLVALAAAVNISLSISSLILYILEELNTHAGIQVVTKLFPNVTIDSSALGSADGSILTTLFANVKISDLLWGTGLDLSKIIQKLPVIGPCSVDVDAELKTASNGTYLLSVVFKSEGAASVVKKILASLSAALHYDLSGSIHIGFGRDGHHHAEAKHFKKHENRHIEHLKHGVQEKIHHHQQQ